MAGKSSIVKKDAKTKQFIEDELIKGTPVRTIARQSATSKDAVNRYRPKVEDKIAEKVAEDKERTFDSYQETLAQVITDMKELAEAIKAEIKDRQTGRYDLSDPGRAMVYVRMLHDTLKILLPYIEKLESIQEKAKQIAEINARPEATLTIITQIIRQAVNIEEAIDRLASITNNT